MRDFRSLVPTWSWLFLVPLMLAACGGEEAPAPEPEMTSESVEDVDQPMNSGPRVVFLAPEEGGTYSADNPVPFEFGIEDYELAAVPEEVDQPRSGMGHHHLGLNTECLQVGEVIPQGNPSWVHFGDASTTIEMMLEPGEHTFVLQLGDDEHRTQVDDGLCARVTFRVEEGI